MSSMLLTTLGLTPVDVTMGLAGVETGAAGDGAAADGAAGDGNALVPSRFGACDVSAELVSFS